MKKIILVSLLASLIGCATTIQDKYGLNRIDDPESSMCSGSAAKRKYSFLLRSYFSAPSGTDASEAARYMNTQAGNSDWVADNFVKILLSHYLTSTQPASVRQAQKIGGSTVSDNSNLWLVTTDLWELTRKSFSIEDSTFQRLAWAGDLEFYLWDARQSGEQPKLEWAKKIKFDDQEACNGFLEYYGGRNGATSCSNYIAPSGLFAFGGRSGFSAPKFIESHYFVASESDKQQLCKDAGLQPNCFEFESDDKIAAMRRSLEEHKAAREKYPYLTHSVFMGSSFAELRSNKKTLLEWQSALIKDLALQGSIKVTKKINGNFTDYRIDWNPTPFCKYGRPKSELYTR